MKDGTRYAIKDLSQLHRPLSVKEWNDLMRHLNGMGPRVPEYPEKDERGGFVMDLRDRCDA